MIIKTDFPVVIFSPHTIEQTPKHVRSFFYIFRRFSHFLSRLLPFDGCAVFFIIYLSYLKLVETKIRFYLSAQHTAHSAQPICTSREIREGHTLNLCWDNITRTLHV